jgi:DNA polymerase I-like protein with 3'-5' exonuclease and polymerase domains
MNLDNIYCGDLESDALAEDVTKIHVLSIAWKNSEGKWQIKSTRDYEDMKKLFSDPSKVIAIHNGVRFDGRVLEKVLGIKVEATIIDTLALAWYIDCARGKQGKKYGLEFYGVDFGTLKPKVDDWENLTYEEYRFRCEEDTTITVKLWEFLLDKLRAVYDNDGDIIRIIKYLNFIMLCARKQEEQKIKVDLKKLDENLSYFEGLKEEKIKQLVEAMPKIPIKVTKSKPKVIHKKDGTLSEAGKTWFNMLTKCNLPEDYNGNINVINSYELGNPNSVKQKKDWLYSLGWVPQTFAHNRDKETNEVKKVEQILTEEKMLCPSVLKLLEKEPAIEVLDGLSVLTHRIGIFKGLKKAVDENGFVIQGLMQLAVSLRWQHALIVNYPRVTGKGDIRDGKWVRECLIAGDGYRLVQSDMSGIESRTSDHYTFHLNRELIEETKKPFFDPHTKISVVSNLMSADEEIWFKWKKENKERREKGILEDLPPEAFGNPSDIFYILERLEGEEEKKLMNKLKEARSKGKTTNYASLYLVGSQTLARNLGITKKEAQTLIDAYWNIHWAVKKATESFDIKKVGDEMWILNPISRFRHNLRFEKDSFSVVNQSSAVYCFNMWLYNITQLGEFPILQTHDDLALRMKESDVEKGKYIINTAMENVNKQLGLNVELACEVQVGDNLAETH